MPNASTELRNDLLKGAWNLAVSSRVDPMLVAVVGSTHRQVLQCAESLRAVGAFYDATCLLLTSLRCGLRSWAIALGFKYAGQPETLETYVDFLRNSLRSETLVAIKAIGTPAGNIDALFQIVAEVYGIVYGTPDRPSVLTGRLGR